MAQQVLLPKLGLTMETGVIEEWLVEAGTPVKPGDPLMRLATDKVNVDVEAEGEGRFHPVAEVGIDLLPGTLIGWLVAEGEDVPDGGAAPGDGPVPVPADATGPAAAADATAPAAGRRRRGAGDGAPGDNGRVFASPNARRVARERGLDVATLRGTGPNGRVVAADVLEAPDAPAAALLPERRPRPSGRRSCGARPPRPGST